ncbi:MAG: hypothetical protein DIU84_05975, partial [Bacillota bacterium]
MERLQPLCHQVHLRGRVCLGVRGGAPRPCRAGYEGRGAAGHARRHRHRQVQGQHAGPGRGGRHRRRAATGLARGGGGR